MNFEINFKLYPIFNFYLLSLCLLVKFNEHKIPFKEWNHFDFLIGKDTDIYVNNVLVNMLLKYENEEMNATANDNTTTNQLNDSIKLTMYDTRTCSISNKCFLFI